MYGPGDVAGWATGLLWEVHQLTARHGKNPARSAVARKVLIATWHVLSREEPFKPSRPRGTTPVWASSRCFLAA